MVFFTGFYKFLGDLDIFATLYVLVTILYSGNTYKEGNMFSWAIYVLITKTPT